MHVLYGVVGEGMGHATRSRVVIEHLLDAGHDVRVVVSGRAHAFLTKALSDRKRVNLHEIHGFHLDFAGSKLDLPKTVWTNLKEAPAGLAKNLGVLREVAEEGRRPDVVVSDFESWAYFYGRSHDVPVLSIDNMQILNRCKLDRSATAFGSLDFQLAKAAVKSKLPGAYHYLVTTFFCPPVRKARTTLVPPILREPILEAKREPGNHVLVYQTAAGTAELLVPLLRSLPGEFRVYGLGREGVEGNVTLKGFSEQGFVDDLRTARAVIANGGLSLMAEAVHLHVPMLSLPLQGQFEQELNARYLSHLGFGMMSRDLDRDAMETFLAHTDSYAAALEAWVPHDNELLFGCVDEVLRAVANGEPPPARLASPALGKYGDVPTGDDPDDDFTVPPF